MDGGGIDGRGVSTLVPLLRRVAAEAGSSSRGSSSGNSANGSLHAAGDARNGAAPALQGGAAGADVAVALCGALRALAANDDICKVCRLRERWSAADCCAARDGPAAFYTSGLQLQHSVMQQPMCGKPLAVPLKCASLALCTSRNVC